MAKPITLRSADRPSPPTCRSFARSRRAKSTQRSSTRIRPLLVSMFGGHTLELISHSICFARPSLFFPIASLARSKPSSSRPSARETGCPCSMSVSNASSLMVAPPRAPLLSGAFPLRATPSQFRRASFSHQLSLTNGILLLSFLPPF